MSCGSLEDIISAAALGVKNFRSKYKEPVVVFTSGFDQKCVLVLLNKTCFSLVGLILLFLSSFIFYSVLESYKINRAAQ